MRTESQMMKTSKTIVENAIKAKRPPLSFLLKIDSFEYHFHNNLKHCINANMYEIL